MTSLVVDSSVWIDALRGRAGWSVDRLKQSIGARAIWIGDLILMEVLQGVARPSELRQVEDALKEFPCRSLGGAERARSAAANYRLLRAAGVTPRSSIDVLIATFCIEEGMELLANDRDYRLMAPHLGLALLEPPLN